MTKTVYNIGANYGITNLLVKNSWEWRHNFIKQGKQPSCDVVRKVINEPPFGELTEKEAILVRSDSIHENGHAAFTPAKAMELEGFKFKIANILDDLRIEKGCGIKYPQMGIDLKMGNELLTTQFNDNVEENIKGKKPALEALDWLFNREMDAGQNFDPSPKAQELIKLIDSDFIQWKDADAVSYDGFDKIGELVETIFEKLKQDIKDEDEEKEQGKDSKPSEKGKGDGDASNKKNGSNSPENQKNSPSDSNGASDKTNSKKAGEGQGKGEKKSGKSASEGKGEKAKSASDKKADEKAEAELNKQAEGVKTFGEMRGERVAKISEESISRDPLHYISEKSHDTVIPSNSDRDAFAKDRAAVGSRISELSRSLEQALKILTMKRTLRYQDKGSIDFIQLPVLIKGLGKSIFKQDFAAKEMNTSVTLLVDCSGSMEGEKMASARKLAIAMSEALEKCGIPFEVLGYSTPGNMNQGYNPAVFTRSALSVKLFEAKPFDQPYRACKAQVGGLQAVKGSNIDGESLLYAAKRLGARKSQRKVMFVISDGLPNGGEEGRNPLLYAHLEQSVKKLRAAKMEVYSFGIGTRAPEKFYGKDNFIHIENFEKLGAMVFKRLASVLTGRK